MTTYLIVIDRLLGVELDKGSIQEIKVRQYRSIGGYWGIYIPGENRSQADVGAPVRPSLLELFQEELFGRCLRGKALRRALRDCLHLDQAQMNDADIFITNDKRLHGAKSLLAKHGVYLSVCAPEQALERLRRYYVRTVGTAALKEVREVADRLGPVILGSNSGERCSFVAQYGAETLASLKIEAGLLHISGRFRDEQGQLLVELKPVEPAKIVSREAHLTLAGSGPILVNEKPANSVVVATGRRTYLAVRMTHTHRVVVSQMELRDQTGQLAVAVQKEDLVLQGASMKV
jgi:hypothetical protein